MEKEDILEAIRRCATENGGKPLGRDRFESATGIRESDWVGIHWVRWNDALAEAGFPPNRFATRLHTDEELLRQLALFVRELGHYPVAAEQRIRRRSDKSFPDLTVLQRRFGRRDVIIARLLEYCSSNPEFNDVAEICGPVIERDNDGQGLVDPEKPDGYVYLVKSGKHYKIGRSNNAGRRFYEIELQLPEKLTVVHHVKTDDPAGIERYWHERFASKRANGEWFALTSADVKAFKRRTRFM
jgi:hypothetical protein